MRILTVGNMYPPHHLGGYELVWRSAVRHLRGVGHEVRVLTGDYSRGAGEEDPEVHRELRWYWRDHDFPEMGAAARLALERHNASVFDRHLAEHQPEVVGWWAMGGMSLSLIERARWASCPSCAFVCDDWLVYGPEVDGWTRAFARRPRMARVAEALTGIPTRFEARSVGPALFPSEATRQRALEARELADTEVCHQGADVELFRPAEEKPWGWRLLYVGRIDRRKGVELAVRALGELPTEATLTIAGGGDEGHLAELRGIAADQGLTDRVRFTVEPREALPRLYSEADVLLFPVLWEEPWGLVPLEAMATGTPVVATGRGGSAEYLRDGENCVLFDPDAGPAALAAAVRTVAADEALRARLRVGGIATAERHSEAEWNRAVERLFRRAVGAAVSESPA